MLEKQHYVMELCEVCSRPIGYRQFVIDEAGTTPIHTTCMNELDLKERGFIPVPSKPDS